MDNQFHMILVLLAVSGSITLLTKRHVHARAPGTVDADTSPWRTKWCCRLQDRDLIYPVAAQHIWTKITRRIGITLRTSGRQAPRALLHAARLFHVDYRKSQL